MRSAFFLILLWGGLCWVLLSGDEKKLLQRLLTTIIAFAVGITGALVLLAATTADTSFAGVRMFNAALFLLLLVVAAAAALDVVERDGDKGEWRGRVASLGEFGFQWLFPLLAGAMTIMTLAGSPFAWRSAIIPAAIALLTASSVAGAVSFGLAMLSRHLPFTRPSRLLLCSSLIFCMAAASSRLDLFAPLSMKIMKFTHDFVHQFLETMLLPDHLFISGRVWNLIGLFFSKEVGFWGGLILWFAPVLLISLAIVRAPLPAVAHVRQGARRRILLAAAIHERRTRLAVPFLAAVLLAWSVYRSLFPAIQYWDPAPLPVVAGPAGEIEIPLKQGELSLNDGKLHKFSYTQGSTKVRFFVLERGDSLVAALDACAICPPDGYGQGEGAVLCYYCKTLIPLATVGRAGGCNPVPVQSVLRNDVLQISAMQLVNLWNSTVQVTMRNSGGKR